MSATESRDRLPGGYAIDVVLDSVGPSLRDEVVGMWVSENALPAAEARRRAGELVAIARAADGEIAAVNTAYVAPLGDSSTRYWFYRTFVRPAHRTAWALVPALFERAVPALRAHPHGESPVGIAAVIENPELARPGARAEIASAGLHRVGLDASGRDVWCLRFDGTVQERPPGLRDPA